MGLLAFQLSGLYAVGSISVGALLAGLVSFSGGLTSLWRGHVFAVREVRRQLQLTCLVSTAAVAAIAAAVALRSSTPVLVGLSVFAGVASGGAPTGFRTLLLAVVPGRLLSKAHYFESMMSEASFMLGPLLIGAMTAFVAVPVALVVMSGLYLAAALLLFRLPVLAPRPLETAVRARLPRASLLFCLLPLPVTCAYGIVESNVPARMDLYHLPVHLAGFFLTILSVGSCMGGLLVSVYPLRTRRPQRLVAALLVAFATLLVPATVAPTAVGYALGLVVASLALVPLLGLGVAQLEARSAEEDRARVFGWYLAAAQIGGGLGSAANGFLLGVLPLDRVPWVAIALLVATTVGVAVLPGALSYGARLRRHVTA